MSTSPCATSYPIPQRAVTPPYATLLSFTRYVGRTGPGKATFVGGLRRQRESRSGFNPHGSLVKALKADIQSRTDGTHLEAVASLVSPRWQPLYHSLTAGALAYLRSLGQPPTALLMKAQGTLSIVGGLTIKINPHFGLDLGNGRVEAIRLHFDEDPPHAETVAATLHLMRREMDRVLPGARPVLVDVRRGRALREDPSMKPDEIERWLAGEAAAFSTMWSATT